MRKPRIFIGSSFESLPIADVIGENLEFDAEVTICRAGTFKLANNALDDLILKSKSVDFSIFIFSPDDVATIRSREVHTVRDNVVFELGLFIGSIGKERCFIVKSRNIIICLAISCWHPIASGEIMLFSISNIVSNSGIAVFH